MIATAATLTMPPTGQQEATLLGRREDQTDRSSEANGMIIRSSLGERGDHTRQISIGN